MQHDDTTADTGKPDERLRLALVVEDLPAGFDVLRTEARAEGHLFLERLADGWQSRAIRFDREGEALLAAFCNEVLVGIGGLTIEPVVPNALRMRRFYVRAPFPSARDRLQTGYGLARSGAAHGSADHRQCRSRQRPVLGGARVHPGQAGRTHAHSRSERAVTAKAGWIYGSFSAYGERIRKSEQTD